VLDFNDYPGEDDIFENMCRGILRSGLSLTRPNEIIIEYIGAGQRATARANRVAAGCRGANALRCAAVFGPGWQCDEFPFATSTQGGASAAVMCVPGTVNGSIGGRWGKIVSGKSQGTNIRVKIKNFDCSQVRDKKRAVRERKAAIERKQLAKRAGAILKNETSGLYMDGSVFGNYSAGSVALIIPLYIPDEFIGTFNINYTIAEGELTSGSLMDDDGEDYGS
jgi:hypothetical protein